jgi:hypothetical protein
MTATQPGWVDSAKHPQQSGPERLLTQFEKDIKDYKPKTKNKINLKQLLDFRRFFQS